MIPTRVPARRDPSPPPTPEGTPARDRWAAMVRHLRPRAEPASASTVMDWRAGGQFTVGAEEELLLVDAEGQLLGPAAAELRAQLCRRKPPVGQVTGEVFVDELELNTPACADAEELAGTLGDLRRWVVAHGGRPMAVAVHPDAPFGAAAIASSARYDDIRSELAGLFRTPTAAF